MYWVPLKNNPFWWKPTLVFPFCWRRNPWEWEHQKHLITTELHPQPSGFVSKTEFHFVVQIGVNMPSSYFPSAGLQVWATMSCSFLLEYWFSEAGRQGWGCRSPPGQGWGDWWEYTISLSFLTPFHPPSFLLSILHVFLSTILIF